MSTLEAVRRKMPRAETSAGYRRDQGLIVVLIVVSVRVALL